MCGFEGYPLQHHRETISFLSFPFLDLYRAFIGLWSSSSPFVGYCGYCEDRMSTLLLLVVAFAVCRQSPFRLLDYSCGSVSSLACGLKIPTRGWCYCLLVHLMVAVDGRFVVQSSRP